MTLDDLDWITIEKPNIKMETIKKKPSGFSKSGVVKKGRKFSSRSPQNEGAGRVPVSTTKVKKTTKHKPMGITVGAETKSGKGTTKRYKGYAGL